MCYDLFNNYLQRIARLLAQAFSWHASKNGGVVRVHFRRLSDSSSGNYSIAAITAFEKTVGKTNTIGVIQDKTWSYMPSEGHLERCDLISALSDINAPGRRIYSLNMHECTHKLNERWKDFITVLPAIPNNIVTRSVNGEEMYCPFLTFGVTINKEVCDELLYVLDYLQIDKLIGNWVKSFLYTFNMQDKLRDFCDYINKKNSGLIDREN